MNTHYAHSQSIHCCLSPQRLVAAAFALLAVVVGALDASAQSVCGPGQTVVDTAGHCCAAGQSWNAGIGSCVSAPSPSTPVQMLNPQTILVASSVVPTPSPPATVPVTFAPERPGDVETLQIQAINGSTIACQIPCVVNVPPGYLSITGSGTRTFQTGLNVPEIALTVLVNHYEPPVGTYVGGAILSALGTGGALGSIYLLANQSHCGLSPTSSALEAAFRACESVNDTNMLIGGIGVGISAPFLIVGAVMLGSAHGHGQHPLSLMNPGEIVRRSFARRESAVRLTGLAMTPIPGGAMVGASVSF